MIFSKINKSGSTVCLRLLSPRGYCESSVLGRKVLLWAPDSCRTQIVRCTFMSSLRSDFQREWWRQTFSSVLSNFLADKSEDSFFFNFLLKKRWEKFRRQPDPPAKPRSFPHLSWGCQFSSSLPSLNRLNEIPIQTPRLTALPGDSHSSALICPSPHLCVHLALLMSSCLWFFPAHQKNH